MLSNQSRRVAVRVAVATVVAGVIGGEAGAATKVWDAGAGTAFLIDSNNWGPANGHPASTDIGLLDNSATPEGYVYPEVMYWAGTGRAANFSQVFGTLEFDFASPANVTIYSTPDNISGRVGLSANAGSTNILSLGGNFGLNSPQTLTLADSGTFGNTLIGLDLAIVGGEAGINVTNAGATLAINGIVRNKLSDAAQLHGIEKTGAGTLVLGGANQFGGAGMLVKVSGGVLQIAADNNLGNANNRVVLNGGTLKLANTANLATSRRFDVTAPSGIDVSNGFTYTINGIVSGDSTLTKTGANELIMNNAAGAFAGTLEVNQGSVRLLNPGTVAGATVKLVGLNSTLNLRNDGGGTYNLNVDATTRNGQVFVDRQSGGGTGGVFTLGDVTLGAVTLNLNGNAAFGSSIAVDDVTLAGDGVIQASAIPVTVNGVVGESGGAYGLKKMGPATLTLTKESTFTGGVNVGGGVLEVGTDGQLGSGAAAVTVATDYAPTTPVPAMLRVTGSFVSNRPVVAGDGTIENAHGVTFGAVTGSGSLVKAGAGRLTVPSIVGGGLSVGEGTVELAAGGGTSGLVSFGYGTGKLDVTDNRVVFGGPAVESVRGWRAGGGVVSSVAQADLTGLTAIGYLAVGGGAGDRGGDVGRVGGAGGGRGDAGDAGGGYQFGRGGGRG
jgi:autotransporter-associated beta strand protein